MSDVQRARVRDLYAAAHAAARYDARNACYAMSNADEYWAEGTQAWFDATARVDVNGGVNSRDALCERDADLAALMVEVYGEGGGWRYTHDCPGAFVVPS